MDKIADAQHPVHELIAKRWSPRAFSAQSVEPEKVLSLLEAARWASSSYNEQPWFFIVATRDMAEDYERLLGCLVEFNVQWARQAPVLMMSVARPTFARNGKPNRHALHDVGQAVANLALQATAMGLEIHQMAGFDAVKAREVFSIPEDYEPVAAIAVGYPAGAESLPEGLRERELEPRKRRPLEEFVFTHAWGQTSPLLSGEK